MAVPKGISSRQARGQNYTLPRLETSNRNGRPASYWRIHCGWCNKDHTYSAIEFTQEEAFVEHYHRKFDYCEPAWRQRQAVEVASRSTCSPSQAGTEKGNHEAIDHRDGHRPCGGDGSRHTDGAR